MGWGRSSWGVIFLGLECLVRWSPGQPAHGQQRFGIWYLLGTRVEKGHTGHTQVTQGAVL